MVGGSSAAVTHAADTAWHDWQSHANEVAEAGWSAETVLAFWPSSDAPETTMDEPLILRSESHDIPPTAPEPTSACSSDS